MNLYAPLYVSNFCINRCRYCGFSAAHTGERRRLSLDEAEAEARVIWPDGEASPWSRLAGDAFYVVRRGEAPSRWTPPG